MKHKALLLLLALVLTAAARAVTFTDQQSKSVWLDVFNASNGFDITSAGYDPLLHQLSSAYASFTGSGDAFAGGWSVSIGGQLFGQASGAGTIAGLVTGPAFAALSGTGSVGYEITVPPTAQGSVSLEASLVASVPDAGASALLLGLGLVALAAGRRYSRAS